MSLLLLKSQYFLITCNYIFCSVKYYDGVNHLPTGSLPSDTRRNRRTHTFTALLIFVLQIPYVCSMGFSFKIQSAHCCSSSLIFATSVVNTLVISKTVQCTIHLVTNVAYRCLSWMGMNILNVAS